MIEKQVIGGYMYPLNILLKYFRRRHSVLIYISDSVKIQEPTTITDLSKGLWMTKSHVYNQLMALQTDGLIEKGTQVKGYFNYILTDKAKKELKIISSSINGEINIRKYADKLRELNLDTLNEQEVTDTTSLDEYSD